MSIEIVALVVSVISAVAAILSIPAFQPRIGKFSPTTQSWVVRNNVRVTAVLSVLTAITLALYVFLFTPCPWYEVDRLEKQAANLYNAEQWTLAEAVGDKLCDCGAVAVGWDWQAKSQYALRQYNVAINFWKRSIKVAKPEEKAMKTANIAAAMVWLNDFTGAVDTYKGLYEANRDSTYYRYGYGRALTFSGKYQEAAELLRGISNSDGGSDGQVQAIRGIALAGLSQSIQDSTQRAETLGEAKNEICEAIKAEPQWRVWLSDAGGTVGHLEVLRPLIKRIPLSTCA